ncbi:hypothetical protein DTX80_17920 [Bacilli bacterium]|nr:hypothetical protein WH51_08445 [Bacilli bacterium VT-13-104]PZD86844.1 hypothetical protein DEJ64_07005 [Bacilli bacterium]PZD88218.1 hypothetical protein DEJ60_07105 [Bacilli bacterium]PZD91495.1 hypothetical protein DEJ66_07525 [Bacilli bacterium]RCO04269.1 hypothetical protein DTX80_17920 [Bacilli bacterium]
MLKRVKYDKFFNKDDVQVDKIGIYMSSAKIRRNMISPHLLLLSHSKKLGGRSTVRKRKCD